MDNNTENNIVITSRSQMARLFYKWGKHFDLYSGLHCFYENGMFTKSPELTEEDIAIIKEIEQYIEPIANYIIDNEDERTAKELFKFQGWFEDIHIIGMRFFNDSCLVDSSEHILENIYLMFYCGFGISYKDLETEHLIYRETDNKDDEINTTSKILISIFNGNIEKAEEFINKIKYLNTDSAKARIAADYCKNGYIQKEDVNKRLFDELCKMDIVHCTLSNWNISVCRIY